MIDVKQAQHITQKAVEEQLKNIFTQIEQAARGAKRKLSINVENQSIDDINWLKRNIREAGFRVEIGDSSHIQIHWDNQ